MDWRNAVSRRERIDSLVTRWWVGFVLLAAFLAVWLVGFFGITPANLEDSRPLNWPDRAYAALQLFVLQPPIMSGSITWELQLARFLAPIVTYVSLFVAIFWLLRDRWREFFASRRKDHVIVCGIGAKGLHLLRAVRAAGYDVVAIDLREPHPQETSIRDAGAVLLTGDARHPVVLEKAGLKRASYVVAFTGDDDVNLEIILQAREGRTLIGRPGDELRCIAHVRNPRLCRLMKEYEVRQSRGSDIRIELFDLYTSAARAVLKAHPAHTPADVARDQPPHVVLIGIGALARRLLDATVREWRFARDDHGASPWMPRIRFTIYDVDVERKFASLCSVFPNLDTCATTECREMDPQLPAFGVDQFATGEAPSIAYVCMDTDARSLTAALALHQSVRANPFPIVACMMEDAGVARFLEVSAGDASVSPDYRNLHGFAVLERTCTADVLYGALAPKIHENWRRMEIEAGRDPASKASLVPWEELAKEWKQDNRRQAEDMVDKLSSIGCAIIPEDGWLSPRFHFSEVELPDLAKLEHQRWMRAKLDDGWRLGPRDDKLKRHPNLLPYGQLDEGTQKHDLVAVERIPYLLAELGLTIHRVANGAGRKEARRSAELRATDGSDPSGHIQNPPGNFQNV